MKSKSQLSCAFVAAVFVVLNNFSDARPHAHGVLENLRRFIQPSNTDLTNASSNAASPCGRCLETFSCVSARADWTSST